jgi:spore germination cell wall hydrolase CwlJ-like protein
MKKLLILALFSNVASADMLYSAESHEQEWCLAQNIYYEARGSSFADQVGVADVVLNRVQSQRYPNTVCDVVRQGYKPGSKSCQFSWYCDGKSDWPTNEDAWVNAQYIAYQMMNGDQYRGITEGATHYHADYVKPSWASKIQHIGQIGAHIYYREK